MYFFPAIHFFPFGKTPQELLREDPGLYYGGCDFESPAVCDAACGVEIAAETERGVYIDDRGNCEDWETAKAAIAGGQARLFDIPPGIRKTGEILIDSVDGGYFLRSQQL